MDVLRANLPRVLCVHGVDALEEPRLIKLVHILQTLEVYSKITFRRQRRRPCECACFLAEELCSAACPACQPFAACMLLVSWPSLCFISAFGWASRIHPRLGSLHSHGGATRSALCSMAVLNAASTSSTLLPPGGTILRWSPITVTTYWRRSGSFISRRRSIGSSPFALLMAGRL